MLGSDALSKHVSCSATRKAIVGFTLIELLVVIAILAILMALAFPLAGRALESARSAKCTGNIRTVGAAMTSYMVENGRYPRSADATTDFTGRFWWFVEIGRYFTDGTIFTVDGWVLKPEPNVAPMRCPSANPTQAGRWPVNLNYGINGESFVWGLENIPPAKIAHPAQTYMVADSDSWCVSWWSGPKLADNIAFRHGGAANFVMCDGHVEKITKKQLLEDKDLEKRLKGLEP